MASITLQVPAALVETIRQEFVRYRAVKFDALASRPARDRSAAQRRAASLVWAIDIALYSVPWDDIRPDQGIELTTDNGLLLEVVYGALRGMAEKLAVELQGQSAEDFDPGDMVAKRMIDNLDGLVDLHGQAHR